MKVEIFVARFNNKYGIGFTAADAEKTMLDAAHPLPEPYRDEEILFPDPKDRGECLDFAMETFDAFEKREKMLAEFREHGNVVQVPSRISYVWVDDFGSVRWEGGDEGAEAVRLKYSSSTSPGWTKDGA